MDLTILQKFEETIRKDIPDFKIVYKDQSKFMKLLGFLVYPFNPQFMDMFTTTIGNTIYFPTATSYTKSVASSLSILAHEYVHLYDSKPRSLWFKLSYLFPQILVVLPLIVTPLLFTGFIAAYSARILQESTIYQTKYKWGSEKRYCMLFS